MAEQYGIDLDIDSNAAEVFAAAGTAAESVAESTKKMGEEANVGMGNIGAFAEKSTDALNTMADRAKNAVGGIGWTAIKTGKRIFQTSKMASRGIAAIGGASLAAAGQVGKLGDKTAKAMGSMLDASTAVNSALEIGRKGMELWRGTVGDSIETSLRFRKEGDATLQYFKDYRRENELIKARIGDALLPVMRGFMETIDATGEKLSVVIGRNQELIGSKLVEWISAVGHGLIKGIAVPTGYIVQAWEGWKMIINVVQSGLGQFLSFAVDGLGGLLPTLSELAGAAGFDGIATKLKAASGGVAELSRDLAAWGDEGLSAVQVNVVALGEMEQTLKDLEKIATDALDRGVTAAQLRVASATVGATKTLDEQAEAFARVTAKIAEQNAAIDDFIAKRQKAREATLAQQEADARAIDAAAADGGGFGDIAGGALGQLGGLGSAIAGGLAGGATGALSSLVGSIVEQSESLQRSLGKITGMFGDLLGVFEPLFVAIEPLVDLVGDVVGIFGNMLRPVFEALGAVIEPVAILLRALTPALILAFRALTPLEPTLKVLAAALEVVADVITDVAGFALDIFAELAKVWNSMVRALTDILGSLGDIKVFGKRPFGFIRDWADDLRDEATLSVADIQDFRRQLNEGYEAMADTMLDGADAIDDATSEIASSLTNVPSGVKVALRRFQSTDVGQVGMLEPTSGGRGDVEPWKEAMVPLVEAAQNTAASVANEDKQAELLGDIKGTFDESGDLIETLRGIRDLTRPNQVGTVNVTAPTPSMADILAAAIAESNRTGSTSDGILAPPANAATGTASQAAGYSGWQDAFARAGVGI